MKELTFSMIVIYNIVWLYSVFKKKDYFGLGTIINLAVVMNVLLYLLKWSAFIESEPSNATYILINSILIIFIVLMCISNEPFNNKFLDNKEIIFKKLYLQIGRIKINIYLLINYMYISLFLVENYLGSGSFIPNLDGIDIHTYSAPLISFITRALFVIILINYLCYNTFKKKMYIILTVFEICMFIILRGARIAVFVALVQFTIFFLLYNYKVIRSSTIKKVKIGLLIIVVIAIGIIVGNMRVSSSMNHESIVQKNDYSDLILYTGPEDPFDLLAWYYGYFPMSYANLNETINYIEQNNLRTYGLYTLRPILVGIFQLDNVFNEYKDLGYANSIRQAYTGAATVRTGFMEFYLDFGVFAFIPIALYALIGVLFYNKIINNRFYITYYSLYAGSWFFMGFQNFMIEVVTWYSLAYIFLIGKVFVIKNKSECSSICNNNFRNYQ